VTDREDLDHRISRRRALGWLGGLGLAALLPACADDEGSGALATSTSSASGTGGSEAGADCVLSPELTEGPFYLDLDLVRRDITEDKPGLPFDLRVNVVDVDACEPIANAAVDIWHCDAGGAYSGVSGAGQESTTGETFLRGIQMTDSDGSAEFRTLYPGWYSGRAVHIHVKVHLGSTEAYTGQLFFDEQVTATVYQSDPYAARPDPDTTNSADGIFGQSGGTTIVAVTPGAKSADGVVTLGVRRA
jgi:protocatechuate 3,4-dioxygenase beta subunit